MRRILILLFAVLSNFILKAQLTPNELKDKLETIYFGRIVFNDESKLDCKFAYNPTVSEGILFVKRDSINNAYGVTTVKSFSFFDVNEGFRRYFYTLPVKEENGAIRKYFVELIYATPEISIVGRNAIKERVYKNMYNAFGRAENHKIKAESKYYITYLLDHRDDTLYPLSKKEIMRMTNDKRDEVLKFKRQKHLNLRLKRAEDYIAVIDYYSDLKKENP